MPVETHIVNNTPWAVSVGGGTNQQPMIAAARKLGYSVLVIGRQVATASADLHFAISTFDTEDVCNKVLSSPLRDRIEVVLTRSSGPALITGSELARRLGLRGHAPELAVAAADKQELARLCKAWGIRTPRSWRPVGLASHALGEELVVKPNQPTVGKVGVRRVSDPHDLESAISEASRHSLDGAAMIQESVSGLDITSLLLSDEGKVIWQHHFEERVVQLADGTFSTGGHEELSHGIHPVDADFFTRIGDCVRKFRHTGFLMLSYRSNAEGSFLYEVNTGLAGDGLAERFSGAGAGFDLFEAEVMMLASSTAPTLGFPRSHRLLIPELA